MEISQISTAVRDLWDFAWPPVILLFLVVCLARLVAPNVSYRVYVSATARLSALDIRRVRAVLRLWGLSKLVPVIAFFLLVFFLYVSRVLIFAAGSLLSAHRDLRSRRHHRSTHEFR